jgi:taspase (threonine aspartase 1)
LAGLSRVCNSPSLVSTVSSKSFNLIQSASVSMQSSNLHRRNSHISSKIDSARDRFRQLRRGVSNSFRKTTKCNVEIISSPFLDQGEDWQALFQTARPTTLYPLADSDVFHSSSVMDGAAERMFRGSQRSTGRPNNVSAIFVHAGAGYHSTTNEHIHLGACDRYVQ